MIRSCAFALPLLLAALPSASDKPQKWTEIRSPHFLVATNASEKQARRVADQFERIRAVFHLAFPHMRVDPGAPIIVLAVKDERSFRALEPEAWHQKGQLKRDGMFQRGPEKNYVLMRLDAEGDNPYHVLYHEYTHLLINQNVQGIPLWLDEGLAEFYGNSEIFQKDVLVGKAIPGHVLLLRESKLLPMSVLFSVDHSSPYYNEENKGSIFYAESWALTHLMMMKSFEEKKSRLAEFLTLVNQNVEATTAATQAFGDLKKLQSDLEGYVRRSSFGAVRMKAETEVEEDSFQARELSGAESAALRADILAHNQRYADARTLLEESLKEKPDYAPAHETMGLIEMRQQHPEAAEKWFAQAVKLDSRSYLAHYYFATMNLPKTQDPETAGEVENSLRAAIKINPEFAPAYATLASFLGMRGERLEEAHTLALQAVQLEPGNVHYFLNVGSVLLRMNRVDDAVRVGERARSMASSPDEIAAAQSFLDSARQYQDYTSRAKKALEESAARTAEIQKEGRPAVQQLNDRETPEELQQASDAPTTESQDVARSHQDSKEGKVIEVTCRGSSMVLTLQLPGYKLELHSKNYSKAAFTTLEPMPARRFNPCQQLRGRHAKVVYTVGDADAGSIVSVQVGM